MRICGSITFKRCSLWREKEITKAVFTRINRRDGEELFRCQVPTVNTDENISMEKLVRKLLKRLIGQLVRYAVKHILNLSPKTIRNLHTMLHKALSHIEMVVLLALYTGMRQGELFELTWSDIHLDINGNSYVKVTQTINRMKNPDKTVERRTLLMVKEPKTPHSQRVIPLLPDIA